MGLELFGFGNGLKENGERENKNIFNLYTYLYISLRYYVIEK